MSGIEIRAMSDRAARKAARKKLYPYMIESQGEIEDMPPFPFPFIGSYVPRGWKMVDSYFVDSSGFGGENEPALTAERFIGKLKVGKGYAVIEQGQFQVYVGEFER